MCVCVCVCVSQVAHTMCTPVDAITDLNIASGRNQAFVHKRFFFF